MNKSICPLLVLLLCFILPQFSSGQSEIRFFSGLGISKDVDYSLGIDYSFNFFFDDKSKFNFGTHIGVYYNQFNEPLLATDKQIYFRLGLQLKYRILKKIWVRGDLGTHRPIKKENYFFNDSQGNPVQDTNLGKHTYISPSIEYSINEMINCFIIYNVAFEDMLDMNTVSLGVLIVL
ncbi:DUF481 domain-containing protein [Winogradskyella arenosi]|uniref:Outer membrane protein with beta-barrel domain n=1 Tax=Winogradskyella arenosi TaxID=533325 RepID=A0A368ZCB0_9FLAO|nr:DUF481 domain-containing protein [Winogradskyella arenosi]RCW89721.1 hypothetical protein DFQ08_1142 [Winogradskyella arenosi]